MFFAPYKELMKSKHTIKQALYRLLGFFGVSVIFLLFTQPLQISCGSATDSDEIEAEIISDLPEGIPAPIAKAEANLGIDSTSLVLINSDDAEEIAVYLEGDILGEEDATVGMVVDNEFVSFIKTTNRHFRFAITPTLLGKGLSLVVLVSGSTEQAARDSGVSEPVVVKVIEEDGVRALQVAVTDTSVDVSDTDLAATFIDEPPLLVDQKIYMPGEDLTGQATLYEINLEQGAWNILLTDEFDNPPVLLRYKSPDRIFALDFETALGYDIALNGSQVAQENTQASISNPRWHSISPDNQWRVVTLKTGDLSSTFILLSRLNELISANLTVNGELNVAEIQCEIINVTTTTIDILVIKRFTDNDTYALELYQAILPTTNLETQLITPTAILNPFNKNEMIGIDIEPEAREEALYICMDNSGIRNICGYNVNTQTTSTLLSIGVNIPRAVYTADKNIVYETSTDETIPSDNKLYLYDQTTNTSRFLTRGFLPSASPTNPGIITHLLIDSPGNTQVGVYNLNL